MLGLNPPLPFEEEDECVLRLLRIVTTVAARHMRLSDGTYSPTVSAATFGRGFRHTLQDLCRGVPQYTTGDHAGMPSKDVHDVVSCSCICYGILDAISPVYSHAHPCDACSDVRSRCNTLICLESCRHLVVHGRLWLLGPCRRRRRVI